MNEDGFVIEKGVLKKYQGNAETVVIPEGVTEIQASAFDNHAQIKELHIPAGVAKIGDFAFWSCTGLTQVAFPEGLTEIDDYAFGCCTGLRSVSFPASLKTLGRSAFGSCEILEEVVLPEGLESVGSMAFWDCEALKRLDIPASVTKFGGGFFNCVKLEEVVVLGPIDVTNYTFKDCLAALILPKVHISALSRFRKPNAVLGFAKACERGLEYDPEVRAGYLKYIKSQRKKLYPAAIKHEALLRLLFEEKLVPAKEVELLLREAGKNNAVRAAILEYQKRYLAPANRLAELETGLNQIDRQAKRAEKQAAKTPEQLAAEKAEKERKAKEKREKALEDFKKTGALPVGIAKELWNYRKRGNGTLCITNWKGECGKFKSGVQAGFEGTPEDVVIPRMIGKDPVTALQHTFHTSRIGSIHNVWQRRSMRAVIVPEGVEEISSAFDGCCELRRLVLPASLKSMDRRWDKERYPHLTVYAPAGSYAESWANENGFPFEALEGE